MVLQDERRNGLEVVVGDTVSFPQPPSAAMVNTLFDTYLVHYRAFHGACSKADQYYFGANYIPVPQDMAIDPIRPATAFSKINTATDHVDISNPNMLVPDPSPRAKDRAERIQKFLQGIWMHIDETVKRTAVRQAIAYGISWVKPMWNPYEWPDAPMPDSFPSDAEYKEALRDFQRKRRISFPFVLRNVHPANAVWDDSRVGPKWFIEFYESTVGDVQKQYPEWKPLDRQAKDIVVFKEYWDDTWMGRMVDHDWVYGPVQHGYGFLPPEAVIPGTSMNWDVGRPEKRFRSILAPIYNLLDTEARLMTQFEAILRQYAWPTLDFIGNQMAADRTRNAYDIFAGKNIVLPGIEVKASERPQPPQEILQQLEIVRGAINEATFPDVVRGVRPTGVSAGFPISVLAGQARLVFGPYADGMARAMERVNRKWLMMVENIARGRVTVRARTDVHDFDQTIGPDDIRGFYENRVFLKAEAPEEREREAILAERLANARIPLISQIEGMRRAGITNPLEEFNQIAAEQLLAMIRPEQVAQIVGQLNLPEQLASAADAPSLGNQFRPGQTQLQRPGERNIQQARSASQEGRPSVFPQGQGGIDILGRLFGSATGGGGRVPSGQRVR